MKASSIIDSIVENADDALYNKGIVKHIPVPVQPPISRGDAHRAVTGDVMADDEETMDGSELLDKWRTQNRLSHFEGQRGVRGLELLVSTLGYDGMEEFFEDNPGAIEAINAFIEEHIEETKKFGPEGWYARVLSDVDNNQEETAEEEV